MNKLAWITAAGAGAALVYFLDPRSGARRRAQVRDRMSSMGNDVEWWAGKTFRDAENRVRGMGSELWANVRHAGAADGVLYERVRAKLGRYTSHPHAIRADVQDGNVVLHGQILSREAQNLVRAVESVRGVQRVDSQLEMHETADIPELQGGHSPAGEPSEWAQVQWTPALRALVGAGGSFLAIRGMQRGGLVGVPIALAGAGLLARAAARRSNGLRHRGTQEYGS